MLMPLSTLDKKQVDIHHEDETVTVTARIGDDLALYWALGFGLEILSPQGLRDKVCASMQKMNEIYGVSDKNGAGNKSTLDDITESSKMTPQIIQIEPTAVISKKTCVSGYKCVMCETQWGVYHVCSQDDYDTGKVVLIQGDKKIEEIVLCS
jgi:hypothetical protein